MGLDVIELVMAIEHEFGVDLPDDGLRRTETVGQLHTLLAEALSVAEPAERQSLWSHLVDFIERETGVARERIVPEARFIRDLGLG